MTNSSAILSTLKTELSHLEKVRSKIEQFRASDSDDKMHQSHLRAYEDLLAAQLVTTAMRYQLTLKWEGRITRSWGFPVPSGWKKQVAPVLSGLKT